MKNLIIDGQILQSNAWYRGMGKYLIQMLIELNKNISKEVAITIIFNNSLNIDKKRTETLNYLCPKIKLVYVELPLVQEKKDISDLYKKKLNQFIKSQFKDYVNFYIIPSLFQFDFFAEFPNNCVKLLLFYDLIPLKFWNDLGGFFPPDLYMKRFNTILEADHIFSISGTTRNDLMNTFGINPSKITNINGGFTKIAEVANKPLNFNIPFRYILFPTGNLPHKNNEVAVLGHKEYYEKGSTKLPLLITSHFSEPEKIKLSHLSKHIIFTDNVSDEELEWLYDNARLVLFTSKYEGLGMPILDAVAKNKPVVVSRISVFEEMTKKGFYFFNPSDHKELGNTIESAINDNDKGARANQYNAILEKYRWNKTCETFLQKIIKWPINKNVNNSKNSLNKLKLAVVSLQPGIQGQIGRLSERIFNALSINFNVDFYFDGNGSHYRDMERPTFLDHMRCKVFDIQKLSIKSYRKYDAALYLIDNKCLPSRVALYASILPGHIIDRTILFKLEHQNELLHDIIVDNQLTQLYLKRESYSSYLDLALKLNQDIISNKDKYNKRLAIFKKYHWKRTVIKSLIQQ